MFSGFFSAFCQVLLRRYCFVRCLFCKFPDSLPEVFVLLQKIIYTILREYPTGEIIRKQPSFIRLKVLFYKELLEWIRSETGLELPAVGEYWSGDLERLLHYLDTVGNSMSLFDVALHYNFFHASEAGRNFDLRTILDNSLVRTRPENTVTFVDNHDTQYGQSLQSFIDDRFKPLAYALILLRAEGKPCVFYSDYYGNPVRNRPPVGNLGKLIKLRSRYAYGEQEDSFDDEHVIGWVRRGDEEHAYSGIAVVMSYGDAGCRKMFMGKHFAGEEFYDAMGNCPDPVTVDAAGWGEFQTEADAVSVWTRKNAFEDLIVNE